MPEPHARPIARRRSRAAYAWGLIGLLLLITMLALPLAGAWWLTREFEARSIVVGGVEAHWLGGPRVTLTDLTLGEPATMTVPKIEARVSLDSLFDGRLASITVKGLDIDLSQRSPATGKDAALETPTRGSEFPKFPALPERLPFARLDLDAPAFSLRTPDFDLKGDLQIQLDSAGAGSFQLASIRASTPGGLLVHMDSAEGTFALAGDAQTLKTSLSPLAVSRAKDRDVVLLNTGPSTWEAAMRQSDDLRLSGRLDRLELPGQALEAARLEVDLDWAAGRPWPSGALNLTDSKDLSQPARFGPLSLTAELNGKSDSIDLVLRPGSGTSSTGFHATLTPDFPQSRATLAFTPIDLQAQLPDPGQWLPFLADSVTHWNGLLHLRGILAWGEKRPRFSMDVDLVDFGARTPFGSVSCAATRFQLNGPDPLSTSRPETLTVGQLSFGIPLTRGRVRYELIPSDTLLLKEMTWDVAGGEILASGRIRLDDSEQDLRLQAKAIALTQLFALLGLEGLSGSGLLDGQLPLLHRDGEIQVRGGKLTAQPGGGWIRYRPGSSNSPLSASGSLDLLDLEQALRNFRYSKLSMELNGSLSKTLEVALKLEGENPEYRDGQPYILNLNVEGRLAALFDEGSRLYTLPARLEKGIAQAAGAETTAVNRSGETPCPTR